MVHIHYEPMGDLLTSALNMCELIIRTELIYEYILRVSVCVSLCVKGYNLTVSFVMADMIIFIVL